MAAVLIGALAVIAIAWRERTWRRAAVALQADRDRSRAELNDVSGLARDLRSPLQGVIGNTELIMASADSDGLPSEELRDLRSDAVRAADIVRTIAAVTETTLSRRWHDLNDIVQRALERSRSDLAAWAVSVDFDRTDRLPLVYIDGRQLERALVALLEARAAHAAPTAAAAATLTTRRFDGTDDRLIVEFEDRAAPVDTAAGADLGACRRIVEAHGGRLAVEHPSHGGYRFVLELPVWTM